MRTFLHRNSGSASVSFSPLFHGQLWSGQDVICVSANMAEHERDEGWHDCLIDRSIDQKTIEFARDKVRPNVEFVGLKKF